MLIPLLLMVLMVRQSSARAEVGGSRTLRQQDLEKGSESSLEIQRRVFLNVISSYLNRPEELNNNNPPDKYNPEFLKDRSHWNKDTSIHLRVIRSPGRSFYFRRRVPPPPIEKGMLLGSNQLGDVVLELSEVSSPNPAGNIRRNMSDGQVVIKDLPMLERRSIPQFGGMVTLYTRTNPLRLLFYGNWCGSGGKGVPLDGIDQCCMIHDKCYGRVEDQPCLVAFQRPYTVHYTWRWVAERKQAYCVKTGDKCAELTCECDRMAAECFSKFVIDAKLEGSRLRKHRPKGNPLRGQP